MVNPRHHVPAVPTVIVLQASNVANTGKAFLGLALSILVWGALYLEIGVGWCLTVPLYSDALVRSAQRR